MRAAFVLTLAILVLPARAHVGIPGGTAPFVVDGAFIGGGTSWGIVLVEDGVPLRVCEEAAGMVVFFHHRAADGRILVGGSSGLITTTDGGCTYTATPELQGKFVSMLGTARDVPGTLFVGANAIVEASVYKSVDDGLTFTKLSLVVPEFGFQSVIVSDDGARVVVSGVSLTGVPRTFVSTDGGDTFDEVTPWPANARSAQVLGFDTDGTHVIALVLDETTISSLVRLDGALTTVLPIEQFESIVTDYAAFDGARYLLLADRELRRQVPGVDDTFVVVDESPMGCLVRPPGDTRLWMCGQPEQGSHFFASDDGEGFAPFLAFDAVVERTCPDGTPGEARCDFSIPDAGAPDGDAGPVDDDDDAGVDDVDAGDGDGDEDDDGGCACGAATSGEGSHEDVALTLALVLVCARRRRRR